VPGDIIILKSGDKVPADCKILECDELFVNDATLTGESYSVEKSVAEDHLLLPKNTPLRGRANSLFLGTFIVSGKAKALVIHTGADTELGSISGRLRHVKPERVSKRCQKIWFFPNRNNPLTCDQQTCNQCIFWTTYNRFISLFISFGCWINTSTITCNYKC
jgi:magnesium-transporting ATPase (P-type)